MCLPVRLGAAGSDDTPGDLFPVPDGDEGFGCAPPDAAPPAPCTWESTCWQR